MQQFNLIRKKVIKIVIRLGFIFLMLFVLADAFWLFDIDEIDFDQINAEYHTKFEYGRYFFSGAHRGLLLFKDEPTYTFTSTDYDSVYIIEITHNDHVADWPIKLNQSTLRKYKNEEWEYRGLTITAEIMIFNDDDAFIDGGYLPDRIEYHFQHLDTFFFIKQISTIATRPLNSGILENEKEVLEKLIDQIVCFENS